ncbi:hypothetical protein Gpo141_00006851 [Globisporangium polare]
MLFLLGSVAVAHGNLRQRQLHAATLKAFEITGSSDCVLANTTVKLKSGVVEPIVRYCSTGKTSDTGTLIGADAGDETEGTPKSSATSSTVHPKSRTGLYVGIVVGVVTVLLLLLATAAWFRRNRRRNQRKMAFALTHDDLCACVNVGDPEPGGNGGNDGHRSSNNTSRDQDSYRLNAPNTSRTSVPRAYSKTAMSRDSSSHNRSLGRMSATRESIPRSSSCSSTTSSSRETSRRTRSNTILNGVVGAGTGIWDDEVILATRIPRDDIVIEARVARGGYLEVYRGRYTNNQQGQGGQTQVVAVKMLLRENRRNLRKVRAFLSDAKLLSTFAHPQIVTFVGVSWDSLANLCTVSEFMDGGDLRTLLVRFDEIEGRPRGFDADKARIALHVAQALKYMHALSLAPVLHRDLKSRTILLSKGALSAKLTDFGGVSADKIDCSLTSGVGTSLWTAPEVVLGKQRFSDKADVFAFGVVLSELNTQRLPYDEAKRGSAGPGEDAMTLIPDTRLLHMVARGTLQVQFSEQSSSTPRKLVELGRACVALDPQSRPTAAQVLARLQNVLKRSYPTALEGTRA